MHTVKESITKSVATFLVLPYFTDNNEFPTGIKFLYVVGVSHCSGSLTGIVDGYAKNL